MGFTTKKEEIQQNLKNLNNRLLPINIARSRRRATSLIRASSSIGWVEENHPCCKTKKKSVKISIIYGNIQESRVSFWCSIKDQRPAKFR
jgi:hypothetical protein